MKSNYSENPIGFILNLLNVTFKELRSHLTLLSKPLQNISRTLYPTDFEKYVDMFFDTMPLVWLDSKTGKVYTLPININTTLNRLFEEDTVDLEVLTNEMTEYSDFDTFFKEFELAFRDFWDSETCEGFTNHLNSEERHHTPDQFFSELLFTSWMKYSYLFTLQIIHQEIIKDTVNEPYNNLEDFHNVASLIKYTREFWDSIDSKCEYTCQFGGMTNNHKIQLHPDWYLRKDGYYCICNCTYE